MDDFNYDPLPEECEKCEGTGWTPKGWANRAPETSPWKGDCVPCDGTGIL